jgi:hypothetical protein
MNVTYENKRTLLKTCPIYKDLEPMFEFDMVDIENIYSNVVLLITHLYEQTIKNSVEIEDFSASRNGDLRSSGKSHNVAQHLTVEGVSSPALLGKGSEPVKLRTSEKLGPISNFVNTLRNDNLILQGQLDLFLNYLSFFLASQQKQYSRIEERITHFLNELQDKPATLIIQEEPVVNEEEPVINKEEPVVQGEEPVVNNPLRGLSADDEKKDSPRLDMAFE